MRSLAFYRTFPMCMCVLTALTITSNVAHAELRNAKEYDDTILALRKVVAGSGEADLTPWHTAADVLGEARAASAVEDLAKKAWIASGRGKVLLPLRPLSLDDYPAAAALAKIGIPSVPPLIEEFANTDQTEMIPAWVIGAVTRSEVGVALVDAFIDSKPDLKEATVARLRKLQQAIKASAPVEIEKVERKEVFDHPAVQWRVKTIKAALKVLGEAKDWSTPSPEVLQAVEQVGGLRSLEAVDELLPHIFVRVEPNEKTESKDPLASRPVARTLARIGDPGVGRALNRWVRGGETEDVAIIAAVVLAQTPPVAAHAWVEYLSAQSNDAAAKARLAELRKVLSASNP